MGFTRVIYFGVISSHFITIFWAHLVGLGINLPRDGGIRMYMCTPHIHPAVPPEKGKDIMDDMFEVISGEFNPD